MRKLQPNTLLFALWLFILLNIIFRDIHQMTLKSHLEMLLTGYYNGVLITDELMLLGGFLALVPITMVLLSLLLERWLLRPVTVVAVMFTAGPAALAPPTDMDDVLHFSVAFIALAVILWIVWRWPSQAATGAEALHDECTRDGRLRVDADLRVQGVGSTT